MAKEKSAIERFAESKFMRKLQEGSQKLASNEIFSTISGGMGATMGLIMVGAVIQIVCAVGAMFGWDTSSASYQAFYMPYKLTMGLMGFFMCFSMAYNYAKRKKMNQMQSAVTGLCSVAISKFVIDHNWTIKLPDVVPEGIAHSFNAIIPMSVNIIVWYGISLIISAVSGGALTLSSLITLILSVPVNFLTSTPGMFVVIALAQLCWFFGIHGTGVIFTVLMVPYITAYTTNAALAAAGQPLQFFPVFLMGANGIMGGAGNTMPFSLMGLKSKSKRIQAVSKASFVPGLFGINEPAIFGYPIMYNGLLLIPFMLCPMVCSALLLVAWNLHWIAYPQVLIMTTLPVVFQTFLTTLDWRNVIFAILMFPVCWLIWRPFYKIYEKQCIEEEAAAEAAELAAQNK